jgi:hypothetical protein
MMHMHNVVTACWLDCMQLILLCGTDSAGLLTSAVSGCRSRDEINARVNKLELCESCPSVIVVSLHHHPVAASVRQLPPLCRPIRPFTAILSRYRIRQDASPLRRQ